MTLAAIYSASVILSATEVCFLLNQDIIVDPKLKQQPETLFLSTALRAQSESIYPCNLTSSPKTYLTPYPIVPHKYLNTCFVATQCTCLGSTINWIKVLTAKQIYGPMLTKNIKDPINYLYIVESTKLDMKRNHSTSPYLVSIGISIILNLLGTQLYSLSV